MGAMRQKRIDSEDKVRESEVLDRHSMGQLFLEQKAHRQTSPAPCDDAIRSTCALGTEPSPGSPWLLAKRVRSKSAPPASRRVDGARYRPWRWRARTSRFRGSISRRMKRCQRRAWSSWPSHSHTHALSASMVMGPFSPPRNTMRRQAEAGWTLSHSLTVMARAAVRSRLGGRPIVEVLRGTEGVGSCRKRCWSQRTSPMKVIPSSSSSRNSHPALP